MPREARLFERPFQLVPSGGNQVIEFLFGVLDALAHLFHRPDESLPLFLGVRHMGKDLGGHLLQVEVLHGVPDLSGSGPSDLLSCVAYVLDLSGIR